MSKSLAEIVAELPPQERAAVLADVDPAELEYDWKFWGRPEQFAPEGHWSTWLIVAGRGFGKHVFINERVWTPTGPVRIGDLTLGDKVFAHDGSVCSVTKIQDHASRDTFRVVFDDGSEVVAGDTHEWNVFRGKARSYYAAERDLSKQHSDWWEWSFQPTNPGTKHVEIPAEILTRAKELSVDGLSWRQIQKKLRAEFPDASPTQTDRGRVKRVVEGRAPQDSKKLRYAARTSLLVETVDLLPGDAIPTAEPLQLPDADLLIDPYVLGVWLGDGTSANGSICAGREDYAFITQAVCDAYSDAEVKQVREEPYALWSVKSVQLNKDLRKLGVLGSKHVPTEYLTASVSQRLELLRGMMDTDGHVYRAGHWAGVGFVNKRLADAVYHLVVSLGMIAHRSVKNLPETDIRGTRPFYGVEFRPVTGELNPFRLPRKRDRVIEIPRAQASRKTMRRVVSITPVGKLPTRCIAIDHRSQLFLVGDALIPTHNTRAGAEWVHQKALENPGCRIALVGRSSSDPSGVMIGGESGILGIASPETRPDYKPSKRQVIWPNGSIAETFSAEAPDQLRGPQFHYAWADEAAAWKFVKDASGLNAWDNLNFATRLGALPQVIATTTPKRTEFMLELLTKFEEQEKAKAEGTFDPEEGEIVITRGSTYDNAANLAKSYIKDITSKYAGTNIAEQELLGLMLDDTTGALWTPDMFEHAMMMNISPEELLHRLPIRVVSLDPSVAENPKDECGIVVVGATRHKMLNKRHAFVLEDASVLGSPDVWARKAVEMAKKWNAPIIAEGTQGQALVKNMIRSIDPSVKVLLVQTGNRGKKVRAEPVLLPYEQKRVHHPLNGLDALELQLTTWDPETSKRSPDRLDALVHGITALLIKPPQGLGNGPLKSKSMARRTLPGGRGTGMTRAGGELGKNLR